MSGTALGITCGVEPNLLYELIVESFFFFSFFFFSLEQTWCTTWWQQASSTEYLYVLMLEEKHQCSQAFVVISGKAISVGCGGWVF